MEACQEFLGVISKTPFESNRAWQWSRWLLFIVLAVCSVPDSARGQAPAFSIGNYRVVNSIRVGRLEDEFTVKADITNSGPDATRVLARVTSTSPNTTIVLPSLSFGDVAAGATKTSTNTFSIRQNRVATFDPSALRWEFTVNAPGFEVAITSPADGLLSNTQRVLVTGTTSGPASSVKINTTPAAISGNTFTADVLLNEGTNTLTAVAIGPLGQVATTSINVTRDSESPRVAIDSPLAGATVSTDRLTVTGTINDTVVGTINEGQGSVTVNGVPAPIVNRTFVAMNVPLTPGPNPIVATGTDRAGNIGTATIHVTYSTAVTARVAPVSGDGQTARIGTVLPQPLVVLATDANGTPAPGKDVIFKVCQNDGVVTGGARTARSVIVPTGPDGKAQVTFQLGTRVGAGNNQVQASVVGFGGVAMFCASSTPAPAAMLVLDAGNRQTGVPGQPLPQPFVAIVVDSGNNRLGNVPITFAVKEGGGTFDGLSAKVVNTDSDGRALATLTLGPDEGIENHRVEATFPGNTGLPVSFTASGMVPGDALQTSISGVVLDNSDVPVPGATIRVLGTARTGLSDAQGQFFIKPVPVGTMRMAVDGSTVTRPGSWVNLDYNITTIAGQDNTIGMPVRLLQINTASGLAVSPTQGGTITLPDYPGFSLKILPGSVTFPDGGGQTGVVTATVVHADKTPEVPNFGQQPRFIVSINPKGCIFNPPAQMCIPNLDGHPPGQKTEMYSFDDSLHAFVSIGTGTVTTDGTQICSDPGSGVIRGGWHCGGNPSSSGGGENAHVQITSQKPIILCKMMTATAAATGGPSPGTYSWSVSPSSVAMIQGSNTGASVTVKAIGDGTATLTVKYTCQSGAFAEDSVQVLVPQFTVTATGAEQITPVGNLEVMHFVSAKGTGDVTLTAAISPNSPEIRDAVTWEGVTQDAGDKLKATFSKTATAKKVIKIKVNGQVCKELRGWIVWSTLAAQNTNGPNLSFTGTLPNQVSTSLGASLNWVATIEPAEIITDADRPDLSGANAANPPGSGTTTLGGLDLSGGVSAKWDISRRIRQKFLINGVEQNAGGIRAPRTYPAEGVVGNDDGSTGDEDNNPYASAGGSVAHAAGQIASINTPNCAFLFSEAGIGDVVNLRIQFGEFARLELNGDWHRISDFGDWRLHINLVKVSDTQLITLGQGEANAVAISPGANGMLETAPSGDDAIVSNTITAGANGLSQSTALSDDIQVLPVGRGKPNTNIVGPGADGALQSTFPAFAALIAGDDSVSGNFIISGPDGIAQSRAIVRVWIESIPPGNLFDLTNAGF